MNLELSIIIPCYNCEATVEQSFDSCFTQGLKTTFEIIMVNDASTDNTAKILEKLANGKKDVRIINHPENMGGGAARNTGIKEAKGNLIYCLDSDNVFTQGSLQKMIDFLKELNADGVAFSERRFFYGNNLNKYESHKYDIGQRNVELTDIISPKAVLLDNFLYTKKSYQKTEGYPENHGFDTQCFEIRYLAKGNKVYFCRDTLFYHRQAHKKSYFQRVYESGQFSKNFYFILEDIFYLFSDKTREAIIAYDIFKNSSLQEDNILKLISRMADTLGDELYIPNFRKYITENGVERYLSENTNNDSVSQLFLLGTYNHRTKRYEDAINNFTSVVKKGVSTPILTYNIMRSIYALSPNIKTRDIEKYTDDMLKFVVTKIPEKNLFKRVLKKITKGIPK